MQELQTTKTTVRVRLDDLVQNDDFQIRPEFNWATAHRYADAMRAGVVFPPVTVAVINGAPVLVDGWHRVEAARLNAAIDVLAEVIAAQPNELRWLSAKANMSHGLPLSSRDMREVFRAYVSAGQHMKSKTRVKSAREIAADLHGQRSHQTVLNWMRRDFPEVYALMRGEEAPAFRGGHDNQPTPEETMTRTVLDHLNEAKKAMRGVTDPDRRGELIAAAEAVLAEMKTIGPWVPAPFDPDPEF